MSRISYAQVLRRVRYAQGRSGSTPVEFTPHTHLLDPGSAGDQEFFDRMHAWQMNHYGNFLPTLTPHEEKMLKFDRPVKINLMNNYLGKKPIHNLSHYEPLIQRGISTMNGVISRSPPLPHDLIVYRGLRQIDPAYAPGPGEILHAPGFSSTSLNARVSRDLFSTHDAVLRIHVPAGTRMAPVTAYQVHDQGLNPDEKLFKMMEQELTLGPGHGFQVTHPIHYNPLTDTHMLNVKLLPQGPPPPKSRQFP